MFENRLKILLILFGASLLGLTARLIDMQVVRADHFRRATEQALTLKPNVLPFVRGNIFDRRGTLLVGDQPCWNIGIDYAVLAADSDDATDSMKRQVKRWKKAKRYPEAVTDDDIAAAFRDELDQMWREIVRFSPAGTPKSVSELRADAGDLVRRIQTIRKRVQERRGFDSPVAEETQPHTILDGLTREQSIVAREMFARYPWVHIEPSSMRNYFNDLTAMAHVLGRVGRVDAEDVEKDPNADDPFAKYVADEKLGISGVEAAAESILRGRRGEAVVNREGEIVELYVARNGGDAVLTIDGQLQNRMYDLLGETVAQTPDCSGGTIVILDVASREVLALVSYPSYDPRMFEEQYAELRDDTEHQPLLFRAVANHYAPGSIVKPLVCLAGLSTGAIDLSTHETCTGYLFEDVKDRWRCWEMHGTNQRMAHGSIDVVGALTGSCNIFMYKLGERLGVGRLTDAFSRVGLGKHSGSGFVEEVKGINPDLRWLHENRKTPVTAGDARNFAIGQGEVTVTPLQAANVMACYASGAYQPVSVIRNAPHGTRVPLDGTAAQWLAIRRGIYGVVNDPDGTAYKFAHFDDPNYVLCGKTGSATTASRPTAFRLRYQPPDAHDWVEETVPGRIRQDAVERVMWDHPGAKIDWGSIEVAERWPRNPPTDDRYAHAWFAGYLQRVDSWHQPNWSVPPKIAYAVLIEYGGSGGRTSGPLGKRVAAELLQLYGPELAIDEPAALAEAP